MTPTRLPSLIFDPSHLAPPERLAAWQAAIPQYDARPAGGCEEDFSVSAKAWLLGEFVVAHTTVSAVSLVRSTERIQADGADTYNLHVVLRGSWTGELDGRHMTAGPGQLVGFDLSRPFRVDNEAGESVSLVIGRSALQDALRGEPDLHGRVFDGAAGLLLSDHCLALARHLPHATMDDATPIVRSTLAHLVAALSAVRSSARSDDMRQSRVRQEVRRYIDRHLGSAELGPAAICGSLNLSRTTLYRSLQSVGGVAAFIQKRRLQAVRALLLHPDETRPISDISQSLGFAGSSHFAAAFRKEFGCSPRQLRTAQHIPIRPRTMSGDISSEFRSWLAALSAG